MATGDQPLVNIGWNAAHCCGVFRKAFTRMLETQTFVDVTVIGNSSKIKCHRVVLSAGSKYFEDLLKDNNTSSEVIIVLPEINQWHLDSIINFLYHGELKGVTPEEAKELMKIADKYKIEGLTASGIVCDDDGVSVKGNVTDEEDECDVKPFPESLESNAGGSSGNSVSGDGQQNDTECHSKSSGKIVKEQEEDNGRPEIVKRCLADRKRAVSGNSQATMEDRESPLSPHTDSAFQTNVEQAQKQSGFKRKRRSFTDKSKHGANSPIPPKGGPPPATPPNRVPTFSPHKSLQTGMPFRSSSHSASSSMGTNPNVLSHEGSSQIPPPTDSSDLLTSLFYAVNIVRLGFSPAYAASVCGVSEVILVDYMHRINFFASMNNAASVGENPGPVSSNANNFSVPGLPRGAGRGEASGLAKPSMFTMLPK